MVLSSGEVNCLLLLIFLTHVGANILAVVSFVYFLCATDGVDDGDCEYCDYGDCEASCAGLEDRLDSCNKSCITAAVFAVVVFAVSVGLSIRLRGETLPCWYYAVYFAVLLVGGALGYEKPDMLGLSGGIYMCSAIIVLAIPQSDCCGDCGRDGRIRANRVGWESDVSPLLPEQRTQPTTETGEHLNEEWCCTRPV